MHTIDLIGPRGEEHHFVFPGTLDELNAEQLGQVALDLLSALPENAIRYRLLRVLAGIPGRTFIRIFPEDMLQGTADEASLLPQLDWLFKRPILERSLIPELTVGKCKYIGPSTALGNFSVLQLSFADICFSAVQDKGSVEALNNLMGALYYPEGTEWNNADIEERGAKLAALPLHVRLGAWLNYKALRNTLPLRYPETFAGAEAKDDFGIDGLLEGLAGDKFGRVDQVGAQSLHPALVHCERQLVRAREMKNEAQKRA